MKRWIFAVAIGISLPAADYVPMARSLASGRATEAKLRARGAGNHRFTVRTENLRLDAPAKELTLRPGIVNTLEWRGRVRSADTPWVAVVARDDDSALRKEVMGAWER